MREKQIPCVDQMSFLSDTMFRETLAKNWTWQSVLGRGRGGTAALLPTALDPPDICYINVPSVVRA